MEQKVLQPTPPPTSPYPPLAISWSRSLRFFVALWSPQDQPKIISSPKKTMKTKHLIIALISISSAHAAIYFDDFTSGSVTDEPNGYIGGFYGNHWNFNQWYGVSTEAAISNDSLTVTSTSGLRGAFILFEPDLFIDGAGEYFVTVNVSGNFSQSNDPAVVRLWGGAGYDLTNNSADGIFVNAQTGVFTAFGTATASDLGRLDITESGTFSLQFTYDGISAIGVFLGAETGGYPFPLVDYNSLTLAVIPEPSSALLACLSLTALLVRRKR